MGSQLKMYERDSVLNFFFKKTNITKQNGISKHRARIYVH